MPVELINPDGLPKPMGYFQVGVATGSKTVYVAGQVARNDEGEPVGGDDLAAQVEQAFMNVSLAVEGVGGSFDDIAKLTIYVVDWTPDKMATFAMGAMRASERLGVKTAKPGTLVGVAALAEPDLLVEIEAIAVLP